MKDEWLNRLLKKGDRFILDIVEEACDRAGQEDEFSSPIEYAMAVAMCAINRMYYTEIGFLSIYRGGLCHVEAKKKAAELRQAAHSRDLDPVWGCIFPEVRIGEYRVDFFIAYSLGLENVGGIVIECDGHEFHEKTKEQVARDKARDRSIQEEGYRVFRFSGSEIWKDPFECAEQVMAVAHGIAMDSEHARSFAEKGDMAGAIKLLRWVQ